MCNPQKEALSKAKCPSTTPFLSCVSGIAEDNLPLAIISLGHPHHLASRGLLCGRILGVVAGRRALGTLGKEWLGLSHDFALPPE